MSPDDPTDCPKNSLLTPSIAFQTVNNLTPNRCCDMDCLFRHEYQLDDDGGVVGPIIRPETYPRLHPEANRHRSLHTKNLQTDSQVMPAKRALLAGDTREVESDPGWSPDDMAPAWCLLVGMAGFEPTISASRTLPRSSDADLCGRKCR